MKKLFLLGLLASAAVLASCGNTIDETALERLDMGTTTTVTASQ